MADPLDVQVKKLENRVKELESKIKQLSFLEKNFSKSQTFNREVTFNKPVYNAAGTKVIN